MSSKAFMIILISLALTILVSSCSKRTVHNIDRLDKNSERMAGETEQIRPAIQSLSQNSEKLAQDSADIRPSIEKLEKAIVSIDHSLKLLAKMSQSLESLAKLGQVHSKLSDFLDEANALMIKFFEAISQRQEVEPEIFESLDDIGSASQGEPKAKVNKIEGKK